MLSRGRISIIFSQKSQNLEKGHKAEDETANGGSGMLCPVSPSWLRCTLCRLKNYTNTIEHIRQNTERKIHDQWDITSNVVMVQVKLRHSAHHESTRTALFWE